MESFEINDLSNQEWLEIARCHPVSSDDMEVFLEDIIDNVAPPRETENSVRKIACSVCSKVFQRKDVLKRHMKIHVRGKEF